MDEINAGAEFVRAFDHYRRVKAAFWLKASDESQRYLYIASDQIDATNFDVAYGEVLRVASQIRSIFFDPFQVKVINADKPLAKAAMEINRRFPGRIGTRLGGRMFGDIYIDSAYIYPSPVPAAVV